MSHLADFPKMLTWKQMQTPRKSEIRRDAGDVWERVASMGSGTARRRRPSTACVVYTHPKLVVFPAAEICARHFFVGRNRVTPRNLELFGGIVPLQRALVASDRWPSSVEVRFKAATTSRGFASDARATSRDRARVLRGSTAGLRPGVSPRSVFDFFEARAKSAEPPASCNSRNARDRGLARFARRRGNRKTTRTSNVPGCVRVRACASRRGRLPPQRARASALINRFSKRFSRWIFSIAASAGIRRPGTVCSGSKSPDVGLD